jgi:hypothetical protein
LEKNADKDKNALSETPEGGEDMGMGMM